MSNEHFIDVPVVSMNDFKNARTRHAFAAKLAESFEVFGFVGMTDTGVPEMLPFADELSRKVYNLGHPFLEKHCSRADRQRGWSGPGAERAKGNTEADPKCHWMTANPEIMDPSSHPLDTRFGPSMQVREVPEFTTVMEHLLMRQQQVSRAALRALELYYGLADNWLVQFNERADSVLRTLWYSKCAPGTVLAAAHEDINLITVLASSAIEGLRLFVQGKWRTIRTTPGVVYVNIGEMLVEIPGLRHLRPMRHDVVATPEMADQRIVYAYFGHCQRDLFLDAARPETRCDDLFLRRIREINTG